MRNTAVEQRTRQSITGSSLSCLSLIATMGTFILAGCGSSGAGFSPIPAVLSVSGSVYGAQQPISGAAIKLYAIGTTEDGAESTPVLAKEVTTDASGRFTISGNYSCPSASSQLYVVALGGSLGSQTNANAASMGLLGPCGALSSATNIHINEITTVASVSALAPFMNGYSKIGFAPSNAATFSEALTTANQLANFVTGEMPGPALLSGQEAPTNKMATLTNILAACASSGGGTAGDSTPCGNLFADSKGVTDAPTNVVDAMMNIAQNPTRNVQALYAISTAAAAYRPMILLSTPANWTLVVSTVLPAPVISPAGGTYNISQAISMSDSNTSAKIYYTTDGTTPTVSSKLYTGAITLTASTTVKAAAVLLSLVGSNTTTAQYIIIPPPAKVGFQTQPSAVVAKQAIAPSITVAVLDSTGKVVPTASNQVTLGFGVNPGKATLSGTTTAAAVNGYATFSNISVSAAGTGYSLVATSSGLTSGTSAGFSVVLPSVIVSLPSSTVAMGRSLIGTVTIKQVQSTNTVFGFTTPQSSTFYVTPWVTVLAGQTTGTFTVTGINTGSGVMNVALAGYNPTSAAMTVVTPTATQSDAFADSVGVNIHLHNGNTLYYTNFPLIKAALISLGVRHVRDGMIDTTVQSYYDRYNELGAAGIKGAFLTLPSYSASFLQTWPSRVSQSFEAYEYPNEYDTVSNGIATLKTFGPTLYSAAKSGPYASAPVIGPSLIYAASFTSLGDMTPYLDTGNLHNYYAGRNPGNTGWGPGAYGSIPYTLGLEAHVDTSKKIMVTETGYGNNTSSYATDVPEAVSAVYMPRLLLEHWNVGFSRTYLYELLSEGSGAFGDYGLLRNDGSTKPAFMAVANLVALVSDKGAAFTPGTLTYTLSGADSAVHEAVMQKRDGTFYLALWLEKPSYDVNSKATITVPSEAVTLVLPASYGAAATYQFDATGSVKTSSLPSAASTALTITDKLLVVRIAHK